MRPFLGRWFFFYSPLNKGGNIDHLFFFKKKNIYHNLRPFLGRWFFFLRLVPPSFLPLLCTTGFFASFPPFFPEPCIMAPAAVCFPRTIKLFWKPFITMRPFWVAGFLLSAARSQPQSDTSYGRSPPIFDFLSPEFFYQKKKFPRDRPG
jgi:hypothetical protein